MSYSKLFRASLSAALVASLLIGCQASDKQRAQIKRGAPNGGGGGGGGDIFTPSAKSTESQVVDSKKIGETFTEVAKEGQNREVLATELENGEYILVRAMYDVKTSNDRNNLVADVDGETICKETKSIAVKAKKSSNTDTKNNKSTTAAPATVNVDQCDMSKVNIVSSQMSNKNMAVRNTMAAATYLRFTVQDKAIKIDDKNLATFAAGFDSSKRGLAIDVLQRTDALNYFALLMGADSEVKGKTYVNSKNKAASASATIRKLDGGALSIAFEKTVAKDVKNTTTTTMVFQYKKVARSADTTPAPAPAPTQTADTGTPSVTPTLPAGGGADTAAPAADVEVTSKNTDQ